MPRKSAGAKLKLNGAGYYDITWTADAIGPGGKKRARTFRASTGTANLAEAQVALAEFLTGSHRIEKVSIAVGDVVDLYMAGHVEANAVDKVRIKNGLDLVKAALGKRAVKSLTPNDCNEYEKDRRGGKIEVRGKKRVGGSSTIRFELTMLQTAIRDAVKNKHLEEKDVPTLTRPDAPPARKAWLRPEDYREKFLPVIPEVDKGWSKVRRPRLTRIFRFVMLAFNTAQRRRAIETLQWVQVDFDTRLIDFNEPGRPITKKRRPVVPVNDDLLAVLKRAYDERLPGEAGKYVMDSRGSIRRTFDHYRAKAGMGWLTRHAVRRTWATWASIRGVSMEDIADVLGDDVETVKEHYRAFSPNHLTRATDNPVPASVDGSGAAIDITDPATLAAFKEWLATGRAKGDNHQIGAPSGQQTTDKNNNEMAQILEISCPE